MTISPPNALTNAQSPLMDSVRRTASASSHRTATAGPLAPAEVFGQAAVSTKPVAPAFSSSYNTQQRGVNQLPTELLVGIFKSCLDPNPGSYARRDATKLHRICAVCHRWKTVAEGTPSLWCYVSSLDPPQHIDKALELSQPMPIAVVYNHVGARVSEETFRAAVNPHTARWDLAFLVYEDLDKAEKQVWESSNLSKLHSLEVISHSDEYTRSPVFLNCGQDLLNLQVAKFLNVPLRLNAGQLPGLRHLELTSYAGPDGFTIPKLLHLLAGTPQLESLGLINMDIEVDAAFKGSIAVHSLVSLELYDVNPDGIRQLLSSIRFPQCDQDHSEAHHQLCQEALNHRNTTPFRERDFDILEIGDDRMHFYLGRFQLSAFTGSDWSILEYMGIVLEGFAEEFTSSKHIHALIEITNGPKAPAITSILNVIDQLPNLRSLEPILSSETAPVLTLIQLLGRPNVLSQRVVWYLPHLEFLIVRVEHAPFLELGELVWERRRAAEKSNCPKEIRELHIAPLDETLEAEFEDQVDYQIKQGMDKLQSKLGRGQLFWGSERWETSIHGDDGPESTW
ncbi:hypothetical protein FS837_011822 [Tulasnella sp. UAMH 9824]|nr:hypothetical protein FS837_011822 [Tulasnella sp. UAMH 9824]